MPSIKTKITPELIASLEYKDRPYFVLSNNYPGFRLKVNPQGRISFITYGRVHFGGNPRTITHGTTKNLTLAEAIEKHLYTTKLLERGQDPNLIKKSKNKQYAIGLDLESIAIQFISDKEMKRDFSSEYAKQCRNYLLRNKLKPLLGLNINKISTEIIIDWYRALEKTPTAANNALKFLSSVFSYAEILNITEKNSNPTSVIKRLSLSYPNKIRDKQIDTRLELPKLIYRIWDPLNITKVNRSTRNAVYLLLLSGLKKSDVLNLKWSQINDNKFIKFRRRSYIQFYPIDPHIQDVIDDMRKISKENKKLVINSQEDWVFLSPKKKETQITNIRKSLTVYSQDFDWVIYPESLRKTFAKFADQAGIPRSHYYLLLGIKKPYTVYESTENNVTNLELKKSLIQIHKLYEKICPMQLPGIYEPLRYFMFGKQ